MKNKITLIFTLTFILLSLSFVSSAHYINGFVENALDGTNPEGMKITMWKTGESPAINRTGTIGLSGDANYLNMYMIDCEMLPGGCNVGTNLSLKVYDNGSGYYTDVMTHLATGAGYSIANNLTLQKKSGILIKTLYPPSSPWVTNQSKINLSYSIYSDEPITKITHSWNDVNTTLYNGSLVGYWNFNDCNNNGCNSESNYNSFMEFEDGLNGGNIIDTIRGKGLEFNNSGYVLIESDLGELNFVKEKAYTVSYWVYKRDNNPASLFEKGKIKIINEEDSLIFVETLGWTRWELINSEEGYLDKWTNYIIIYKGSENQIYAYRNGIQLNNGYINYNWNANTNTTWDIEIAEDFPLNGIISDYMIFNRSLSQNEVIELYNTQITKYNTSYIEYNVSKNLSPDGDESMLYVNDIGSSICSIQGIVQLNAGFSEKVGTIRNDFYGSNTHGTWLREGATINNGSTYPSDLKWHRETFLEGGYTFSREDMNIGNYYNDGTGNWTILRKGNTTRITQEYEWARQNGVKILNIISYMPEWLADNSSGKCEHLKFCPPTNYTYYAELVKDYINRTTLDGEYLDIVEYEFWNEPEDEIFFMGRLPDDHPTKSIEINKMFNATTTTIRQYYPNAIIGGLGLAHCDTSLMRDNFLGNFSNPNALNFSNFFSCHNYIRAQYDISTLTQERLGYVFNNCSELGAEETCRNIYISEFNLGHSTEDDWIKNTSARSNEYESRYSLFYAAVLNSYPGNVSMITYQWADRVVYGPGYPEYPHQWYSVQEPALGLEYKPPYNVTRAYSHLCPSGSDVYKTEVGDGLQGVSCKNGDTYSIIITNEDDFSKNIVLDLDGNYPYKTIKNYETNTKYTLDENNEINLGVIDAYDVVYLYSGFGHELKGLYSLNENTGNKVYDKLKISNSGTISGASWENDEELIDLSSGEYTLDKSKGIFTFINTNYLYSYILLSYDYKKIFGFHVSILELIAGFLMIVILGIAIIYVSKYIQNLKEVE